MYGGPGLYTDTEGNQMLVFGLVVEAETMNEYVMFYSLPNTNRMIMLKEKFDALIIREIESSGGVSIPRFTKVI